MKYSLQITDETSTLTNYSPLKFQLTTVKVSAKNSHMISVNKDSK